MSLPNLIFEKPWATEKIIFIVEAYFRQKSIHAAQLQFKERFECREFPVHSMIYWWVNKFRTHCTVHNLNHKDTNRQSHSGRPKSSRTPHNVAAVRESVGHSPRTTTSGLWQSTPSDMSRCLENCGQHLVDGEGSSGFSSGSSRMVPPSTPQTNHWHGYRSVSLTDWSSAVVAAFIGLEHPRFLPVGCLKNRVYGNYTQSIPDLKTAITAAIRAIPREECGRSSRTLSAGSKCACSAGELIWSTFFWAPVKQRVFVVQTWNFGDVCYTGLT